MSNTSKFVYALAFQIGWFVCIMAGNLASLGYALIFLICHFWFLTQRTKSHSVHKEILWVITVFCLGLAVETVYFSGGLLYSLIPNNLFAQVLLPPVWLMSLWLIFSLAMRTCLSFIFHKPLLSYFACVILIPINYYCGAWLNNEVDLNQPYFLSLSLIALIWIVFLWHLILIKRHYFEDIFNVH